MNNSLTVPTGILTDAQRSFLRGEHDDVADPDHYENQLRHRANKRVAQIAEDIELLEATGHADIVAKFYYRVDRIERLRRDINTDMEDRDS